MNKQLLHLYTHKAYTHKKINQNFHQWQIFNINLTTSVQDLVLVHVSETNAEL